MKLGYIGLGKMGIGMATRFVEKGHDVVVYNRSDRPKADAEKACIRWIDSLEDMVAQIEAPRLSGSWCHTLQLIIRLLCFCHF